MTLTCHNTQHTANSLHVPTLHRISHLCAYVKENLSPVWKVPQSMCMAVISSGIGTTAGFFVESSGLGAASSEGSLSTLGSPAQWV